MDQPHIHNPSNTLSDFILGSQDGIVNVLGVILGVAIASQSLRLVLVSGLSATFAESIAMTAVAYTSTLARRDQYYADLEREKREMKELPDTERQEIVDILQRWGFQGKVLDEMTDLIVANPQAMLEIMMSFELNLAPVGVDQARRSAFLVGSAALLGSLIPLFPFFIWGNEIYLAIVVSFVSAAIVLFLIGWFEARVTVGRPVRSGLQLTIIGTISALIGFAIGFLIARI